MAVFVFKVLSIAVKTLARPLINWVSYYNRIKVQESNNRFAIFLRSKLVVLGNNFNYYNNLINKKIFGLTKETHMKTLTPEKALERGAELVSEIVVYTILLSLPIYEMIKSYKSNKEKLQNKKDYVIGIQNDVDSMIELRGRNIRKLEGLNKEMREIYDNLYSV